MEIKLEWKPTPKELVWLSKQIEKEALSDLSDYWDTCKKIVIKSLQERFKSENWKRWAPLSPRYKAWKEKHYPGMPILQRTRALYKAATVEGADGNVYAKEAMWMSWGVDRVVIPWAAYVQDAPQERIWCALEDNQEKEIHKSFTLWLRKKLDAICQRYK